MNTAYKHFMIFIFMIFCSCCTVYGHSFLYLPISNLLPLGGQPISFANASKEKTSLVIVAFHPNQQISINHILNKYISNSNINVFEIPVIPSKYKIFKPKIESYMKNKLPNPDYQRVVYPIFTDTTEIRKKLNINEKKMSSILIVSSTGELLYKEDVDFIDYKLNYLFSLIGEII